MSDTPQNLPPDVAVLEHFRSSRGATRRKKATSNLDSNIFDGRRPSEFLAHLEDLSDRGTEHLAAYIGSFSHAEVLCYVTKPNLFTDSWELPRCLDLLGEAAGHIYASSGKSDFHVRMRDISSLGLDNRVAELLLMIGNGVSGDGGAVITLVEARERYLAAQPSDFTPPKPYFQRLGYNRPLDFANHLMKLSAADSADGTTRLLDYIKGLEARELDKYVETMPPFAEKYFEFAAERAYAIRHRDHYQISPSNEAALERGKQIFQDKMQPIRDADRNYLSRIRIALGIIRGQVDAFNDYRAVNAVEYDPTPAVVIDDAGDGKVVKAEFGVASKAAAKTTDGHSVTILLSSPFARNFVGVIAKAEKAHIERSGKAGADAKSFALVLASRMETIENKLAISIFNTGDNKSRDFPDVFQEALEILNQYESWQALKQHVEKHGVVRNMPAIRPQFPDINHRGGPLQKLGLTITGQGETIQSFIGYIRSIDDGSIGDTLLRGDLLRLPPPDYVPAPRSLEAPLPDNMPVMLRTPEMLAAITEARLIGGGEEVTGVEGKGQLIAFAPKARGTTTSPHGKPPQGGTPPSVA